MVKISCPSTTGGFAACAHPSGTGRTEAATFGSIQRTATSRTGSAARTLAATLTAGVSCTSTDVAVADDPLVRRDEPLRVDHESRRVRGRRPEGDDAVLPLRQEERGVGLQRRGGGRRRRGDATARPRRCRPSARGPRRGRRRCPPSASTGRPCPGTRPAGPIPPCSCPGRSLTSAVPSSAVTIRRGAALGGLSLMSSAWRGTGVAFCSASTRTILM